MDGEIDDKDYVDDDDDRQPTGEVDEVEVEGHLEGETWNNLRRRIREEVEMQNVCKFNRSSLMDEGRVQ